MNSGRFSDKELQELHEEVRTYIPKFVKLQEDVSEHLLEEREGKVLLRNLCRDVKCLHEHMELYRPFLEGAIKGQADMAKLRKAIIEKTAIGLVWAAIAGLSVLLYHGMIEHLRHLFVGK